MAYPFDGQPNLRPGVNATTERMYRYDWTIYHGWLIEKNIEPATECVEGQYGRYSVSVERLRA